MLTHHPLSLTRQRNHRPKFMQSSSVFTLDVSHCRPSADFCALCNGCGKATEYKKDETAVLLIGLEKHRHEFSGISSARSRSVGPRAKQQAAQRVRELHSGSKSPSSSSEHLAACMRSRNACVRRTRRRALPYFQDGVLRCVGEGGGVRAEVIASDK